jgi:putative protease
MNNPKKIEVLCPAGDMESVTAAVQNGANAVYLGMKDFSARQSAKNFDYDDLREAISYCHARGVFVYLALNTILFDNQFEDAKDCIAAACELGVDAIIVQDLGVLSLVQKMCPTMPIHASTQMAVHTVKGAQLLKEQGVTRVVLARELTLQEIKEIAQTVEIETEVFVHGALCMSVSGQCYMSGMIGTRSGNRGNCAGTCRLPFTSNGVAGYDLSLKDSCLVNYVEALKQAGVTSLKIEGRMKRPEYVAAAASAYHNAAVGEEADIETLQAVFSRSGFTDGYLTGKADASMFGYRQKEDVVATTNQILKSLQNTYKKERPCVAVTFHFVAKENQPISLTITDCDNNQVTVTAGIPEIAQKAPMNEESVQRSLSKLGGTPF